MKRSLTTLMILSFLSAGVAFAQDAAPATPAADAPAVTAPAAAETTAAPAATNVTYLERFYQRKAQNFKEVDTLFVNSDVYFKLSSEEKETGLDKIEYSIDGSSYKVYTSPFNLLAEGFHVIQYKAIDNGANEEKVKVLSVYVDNTAPTSKVETDRELFVKDGVTYASSKTNFYVSAQDADGASGVKLTYGGTELNRLSSNGNGKRDPKNFFKLEKEGATVFYFSALDNVGNLGKIAQYNVTVDATAPVVAIQGTNNLKNKDGDYILIPSESLKTPEGKFIITGNEKIGFTAVDNLSGVSALYVKVNDEDFVKYSGAIEVKGAPEYVISVKAEDNVGNISEASVFTFKVDNQAPASKIDLTTKEGDPVTAQ